MFQARGNRVIVQLGIPDITACNVFYTPNMDTFDFKTFFERVLARTPITTQTELAEVLGIGRAAISIAKQKNNVPAKWILTLSSKYNLPPDVLSGDALPDDSLLSDKVVHVCELDAATPGGIRGVLEDKSGPSGSLIISRAWLEQYGDPDSISFLDLHQDNMEPEIPRGSRLFVDVSQTALRMGGIYVLELQNETTVRRVDRDVNSISLLSSNQVYLPLRIPADTLQSITVLGRVIFSCRPHTLHAKSDTTGPPKDSPDSQKRSGLHQYSLLSP